MYSTWHRDEPDKVRRSNQRSKDGCNTCRKRRVRCNQQRPKCSHCTRLNLDCSWKSKATQDGDLLSDQRAGKQDRNVTSNLAAGTTRPPTPQSNVSANPSVSLEKTFDFASFLWDQSVPEDPFDDPLSSQWTPGTSSILAAGVSPDFSNTGNSIATTSQSLSVPQLLEYFKQSDAPPILAPIETRARWNTMRDLMLSMTTDSSMVRNAVLVFSVMQVYKGNARSTSAFNTFYVQSQEQLTSSVIDLQTQVEGSGGKVQQMLVAAFLLSYVDLLTDRAAAAHVNLRMAFDIVSCVDRISLDQPERRLLSWIRLLDGRAVSAGGEGLFLNDDGDEYDHSRSHSPSTDDAEASVTDYLSKPALRFFQKVQSYTGRIARIDQWHRSRGTVEDETEVMAIGAQIRKDTKRLYQHRHPLMDLAAAGKLSAPLLAPTLASTVTRSARVALSNYHAIYIHLHRVAYKTLPRTAEMQDAMTVIRQFSHLMVEGDNNALPVNMLWPLLMWGSEEDSPMERTWVIAAIRQMATSASNAGITADVLEEVWRRQDGSGQRADIRTVMHETFDSCFAIV